ncbi:hypothetical protein JCM9279_007729 [Rhodotorula babjevae]
MSSAAGPSASLLDRLQAATRRKAPREARADLASELLVQLSSEAHEIRQDGRDIETTLFADAFPLLNFLVPLLSADEVAGERMMTTSDRVRSCTTLVATVCSPKEVVMAVEQQLAELLAGGFGDSTDDDGVDDDARDSACRLACLTTMYANALIRIKTKRPLPFLDSAVKQLRSAMTDIARQGPFMPPGPASTTLGEADEGDLLAVELLRVVLLFVRNVHPWVVSSAGDDRAVHDKALAPFNDFLHDSVALLHPFVPNSVALEFFFSRFPVYRRPGPRPASTASEVVWELAESVLHMLRVRPASLAKTVTSTASSRSSRLGALVLLAHMVAAHPSVAPDQLEHTVDALLVATLDIIRARQSDPLLRVADDETLFWLWWCVEQQLELEEPFGNDLLFDLVEVVTPLASLSPNPQTRFLAFRLLARLVTTADGDTIAGEATQVNLLEQLVVDCPAPSLRAASVGLVKEVLLSKLELPPASSSLFLDGSFFSSPLGDALLLFDPPDVTLDTLEATEFVEQHRAGVMERLSLLFVLLKRDQQNRTGIADPPVLANLRSRSLGPLRAQLAKWPAVPTDTKDSEAVLDAGLRLELDLVGELLDRVEEAVQEVEGRSSEPYDPYVPGGNPNMPGGGPGPSGSTGGGKNNKTAQIQQQIDDTVGIMRENITKVAERGERLDALQDKTDNLAQSAQGFRRGANRVRKQMWWKDMKMRILIAVGIAILVVVIVVPIVVKK